MQEMTEKLPTTRPCVYAGTTDDCRQSEELAFMNTNNVRASIRRKLRKRIPKLPPYRPRLSALRVFCMMPRTRVSRDAKNFLVRDTRLVNDNVVRFHKP